MLLRASHSHAVHCRPRPACRHTHLTSYSRVPDLPTYNPLQMFNRSDRGQHHVRWTACGLASTCFVAVRITWLNLPPSLLSRKALSQVGDSIESAGAHSCIAAPKPQCTQPTGGIQDPGVANPPASPASAEAATKQTDGAQDPGATTAPASAAATEAATADASRPVPAAPAPADVTQPGAAAAAGDPATPSEAAPAAASAAAAPPAQPDTVALPVGDSIEQPVNTLTHTLVHELRKYVYDFGRADKQLSALGLSNNLQRKDRKPKPKAGNHAAIQSTAGDAGSKPPAAEAGASTAPEPAPVAADAPSDVAVAGEGNAAVGGDVKVADAGAAADVDMTGAGGKPDTVRSTFLSVDSPHKLATW